MNREHFHNSIVVVKKVNNLWNVYQQCGSKAWHYNISTYYLVFIQLWLSESLYVN